MTIPHSAALRFTIDDDAKSRIASAIWGRSFPLDNLSKLSNYFEYFRRETRQAAVLAQDVHSHDSAISAFGVLRANTAKRKQELEESLGDSSILDLAVRLMFMTGCQAPGIIGGDIFRPRWKCDESFCRYIQRVYPRTKPWADDSQNRPISINKLSVDYLKSYANVDIRWTNHLTDHLLLLKGSDWKSVYIFAHPAFISTALSTLQNDGFDLSQQDEKALSKGCLPPALLRETLESLELLFPLVGDANSRRILNREVAQHRLDPTFLHPLEFQLSNHNSPSDAQKPTDLRVLYERFPFWATRLHDLWAEAEDPAPTSYIGKLADRKKSPRFMYWCGVLGVIIAVSFGLLATILGALQVWISYCSWLDDPSVRGCGLKKPSGTNTR